MGTPEHGNPSGEFATEGTEGTEDAAATMPADADGESEESGDEAFEQQ